MIRVDIGDDTIYSGLVDDTITDLYEEAAQAYDEQFGEDASLDTNLPHEGDVDLACECLNEDDAQLLRALVEFRGEVPANQWRDGVNFIHDDHFEDFARELAVSTGAIEDDTAWPCNRIDWEEAASDLRSDYTCIDLAGESYYYR